MNYAEDFQKTSELTRLILPTLSQLQIPINPVNFALFYEYYTGNNEVLKNAIDEIINGTQPYEEEKAHELYVSHVVNPGIEKMEEIQDETRRLLSQLFEMTTRTGADVSSYGNMLDHSMTEIEENSDVKGIHLVVSSLMRETNVMMDTNRKFEKYIIQFLKLSCPIPYAFNSS